MTPAERAQELFNKFYDVCNGYSDDAKRKALAKQCALILIDEQIALMNKRGISAGVPFLVETKEALAKL